MPWWQQLLEALGKLLLELKLPAGFFGGFFAGKSSERLTARTKQAERGKEVLGRALSVPPVSVPDDALDDELRRRDLLRVAGVKTHRDK